MSRQLVQQHQKPSMLLTFLLLSAQATPAYSHSRPYIRPHIPNVYQFHNSFIILRYGFNIATTLLLFEYAFVCCRAESLNNAQDINKVYHLNNSLEISLSRFTSTSSNGKNAEFMSSPSSKTTAMKRSNSTENVESYHPAEVYSSQDKNWDLKVSSEISKTKLGSDNSRNAFCGSSPSQDSCNRDYIGDEPKVAAYKTASSRKGEYMGFSFASG